MPPINTDTTYHCQYECSTGVKGETLLGSLLQESTKLQISAKHTKGGRGFGLCALLFWQKVIGSCYLWVPQEPVALDIPPVSVRDKPRVGPHLSPEQQSNPKRKSYPNQNHTYQPTKWVDHPSCKWFYQLL